MMQPLEAEDRRRHHKATENQDDQTWAARSAMTPIDQILDRDPAKARFHRPIPMHLLAMVHRQAVEVRALRVVAQGPLLGETLVVDHLETHAVVVLLLAREDLLAHGHHLDLAVHPVQEVLTPETPETPEAVTPETQGAVTLGIHEDEIPEIREAGIREILGIRETQETALEARRVKVEGLAMAAARHQMDARRAEGLPGRETPDVALPPTVPADLQAGLQVPTVLLVVHLDPQLQVEIVQMPRIACPGPVPTEMPWERRRRAEEIPTLFQLIPCLSDQACRTKMPRACPVAVLRRRKTRHQTERVNRTARLGQDPPQLRLHPSPTRS